MTTTLSDAVGDDSYTAKELKKMIASGWSLTPIRIPPQTKEMVQLVSCVLMRIRRVTRSESRSSQRSQSLEGQSTRKTPVAVFSSHKNVVMANDSQAKVQVAARMRREKAAEVVKTAAVAEAREAIKKEQVLSACTHPIIVRFTGTSGSSNYAVIVGDGGRFDKTGDLAKVELKVTTTTVAAAVATANAEERKATKEVESDQRTQPPVATLTNPPSRKDTVVPRCLPRRPSSGLSNKVGENNCFINVRFPATTTVFNHVTLICCCC